MSRASQGWQFVGREEIDRLSIDHGILTASQSSRWDPEWMAYWVQANTPLDTWLRLQGCEYSLVIREVTSGGS